MVLLMSSGAWSRLGLLLISDQVYRIHNSGFSRQAKDFVRGVQFTLTCSSSTTKCHPTPNAVALCDILSCTERELRGDPSTEECHFTAHAMASSSSIRHSGTQHACEWHVEDHRMRMTIPRLDPDLHSKRVTILGVLTGLTVQTNR